MPFHQKNLPKGRNFTYLEDPGIMKQLFTKPIQKSRDFWVVFWLPKNCWQKVEAIFLTQKIARRKSTTCSVLRSLQRH